MTTYLALLRGINLGSRNQVAMPELATMFTELGHGDVRTHLQTGNVVFTTRQRDQDKLARAVEQAITERFGLDVPVQLRTADDLAHIRTDSPFASMTATPAQLQVTFLATVPDPELVATVDGRAEPPEELTVLGREVYLHCPNGYGRTKLSNAFLERRLKTPATTRNWRVVGALHDLMTE